MRKALGIVLIKKKLSLTFFEKLIEIFREKGELSVYYLPFPKLLHSLNAFFF